MTPTAAIATLLRQPGPALPSFLEYHLGLGFSHIFLFFDDPQDTAMPIAQQYPHVTCIPRDSKLERRWRATPIYRAQRRVRAYIDREVRARQILNVAVAIEMGLECGIDWLYHIDIDELIYLPGQTLPEHLLGLSAAGVERVTYLNHEAVPEAIDISDYFREVTLFRRNLATIPGQRLNDEQRAAIARTSQLAPRFYHFYANGKSGVRLREGVWPGSAHSFTLPQERTFWVRAHRRLARSSRLRQAIPANSWLGQSFPKYLRRGSSPVKTVVSPSAMVLHYACCGFDYFWNKYEMRGAFSDRWFGRLDIATQIGAFHLEARDVVQQGNREKAKTFYRERLMMDDADQIRRLQDLGLLVRITEPAKRLEG
jgi:hypothetical protein